MRRFEVHINIVIGRRGGSTKEENDMRYRESQKSNIQILNAQ